jgi:hypothetical protein
LLGILIVAEPDGFCAWHFVDSIKGKKKEEEARAKKKKKKKFSNENSPSSDEEERGWKDSFGECLDLLVRVKTHSKICCFIGININGFP